MQDLYASQYPTQRAHQWSRSDYPQINTTGPTYPQQPSASHSSSSNGSPTEDSPPASLKVHEQQQPPPPKSEAKPQATFLTKLYALLERPENHHMIRWDPAGEHIIVERPEQLALHVLPSIYRQSRFASFSRQLNIYGFMRKVNLRNVDPAIDDPDASTWSHPTLNRHSPPEVVANFKRRVPPRLPKPRKRDTQEPPTIPPPRTAIGNGPVPLTVPSSLGPRGVLPNGGRARGFSAPGSFTPLNQSGAASWNTSYPRNLPPLTVPSEPTHHTLYNQSHLQPISPAEESPTSQFSAMGPGSGYHHAPHTSNRDMLVAPSQYSYTDQNWQYSQNNSTSNHSGSLSSLLNPPSNNSYGPRPTPTINTSYSSAYSGVSMHSDNSPPSLSPDSRPTTGYSISSVSSLPYEDSPSHHSYHQADYSRPGSSHHRPISPSLSRPPSSSKQQYGPSTLSIRRPRRHSQAMSPYPSPYGEHPSSERPSTSPHPVDDGTMPRVRSMIQLPSVDSYGFPAGHAEFAYSAVGSATSIDSMDGRSAWGHHAQSGARPSTSTSSISAASHTSSSQANTPPLGDAYGAGEADINRFSPDFGFIALNENLPPQYTKTVSDL